jgi:hypothetical protein
MPTALDNGQRSPRKLLRAVIARLLGRKPYPRTRLLIGAVRAIEGSRQSAPRLTVGTAARDRATPRTQFLTYLGERGALPGSPIVVWCRTEPCRLRSTTASARNGSFCGP